MRRGWMVLLASVLGLVPTVGVLLPRTALAEDVIVTGGGPYGCNDLGLREAIAFADDGGTVRFMCTGPTIAI